MTQTVKVKLLNDLATFPTFGSDGAAGIDLYAATEYDIVIQPYQTVKIDTGLAMAIPNGYFGAIPAQSRIAQLIISPVPIVNYIQVKELDETERGEGGFGSTGVK